MKPLPARNVLLVPFVTTMDPKIKSPFAVVVADPLDGLVL